MITGKQCKLARVLLDLSQKELADHVGTSRELIVRFENTETCSKPTIESLTLFFESHGVDFLPNNGVQEKTVYMQRYRGAEGFRTFMDHVYEVAKDQGGEICLYNARPANWIKWLGKEWNAMHSARMAELVDQINFKATAQYGDTQLIGHRHAEYRWIPEEMWNEKSFYAYGDYIGFLIFSEEDVSIFVIKEKEVADSFRSLFNIAWDNVSIIPDTTDQYKPSTK